MKKVSIVLVIIAIICYTSTAFGQTISFVEDTIMPLGIDYCENPTIGSGDINSDGKKDIVSLIYHDWGCYIRVDYQDSVASIFQINVPLEGRNFVLSDENSDGRLDIALVCNNNLYIFLNENGGYQYEPSQIIFCGGGIDGIAVGDFNNDERPDFVTCCTDNGGWSDQIKVIYNLISGYEIIDLLLPLGENNHIETSDINSDGWQDIILLTGIQSQQNYGGVYIYLNDANGMFSSFNFYTIGYFVEVNNVSIANIYGTGNCIVINTSSLEEDNTKIISYQNGMFSSSTLTVGKFGRSTAVGDFNKDGKDEIAYVSETYLLTVVAFLANGGVTTYPYEITGGSYDVLDQAMTVGDFNNDNWEDIAVISDTYQTITIMRNDLNVAISEINDQIDFEIYPNPTCRYLNVSLNRTWKECNYIIIDGSGRIVLQQNHNGQDFSIDLEAVSPGIYFLIINGNQFTKFIVQ